METKYEEMQIKMEKASTEMEKLAEKIMLSQNGAVADRRKVKSHEENENVERDPWKVKQSQNNNISEGIDMQMTVPPGENKEISSKNKNEINTSKSTVKYKVSGTLLIDRDGKT